MADYLLVNAHFNVLSLSTMKDVSLVYTQVHLPTSYISLPLLLRAGGGARMQDQAGRFHALVLIGLSCR